jgi:ATP-dependent Clp protease adaptor protein ClpS
MPNLYGNDNEVLERTEVKRKEKHPDMYHVVFYNDDYTHMEFVVFVLYEVFGLSEANAFMTMLQIHTTGKGIVGTYTRNEAYEKVDMVDALKAEHNQPLVVDVERA